MALIETTAPVCVERFSDYPQLGRFTLRDEGRTIAIGKVCLQHLMDVVIFYAFLTAQITKLIEGPLEEVTDSLGNLSVQAPA